jgi:hypothetical protein
MTKLNTIDMKGNYVIFYRGICYLEDYFDVSLSYKAGMVVYDTRIKKYYIGSKWIDVKYGI